jgi:glutathione synthase/RimK-type ligase-like ATP-grasp enzyme
MRVYLATCARLPEPDPDEALLVAALATAGVEATLLPWDGPAPAAPADLCVVRSTWNYHQRRDDFLAWAAALAAHTPLANPLPVLRWSTDKAYLGDLAAAGVPVVPTAYVDRARPRGLAAVCAEHGWGEVVVKPRVSAGSFATRRFAPAAAAAGEAFLAAQLRERDMMVQPYFPSVEGYGERALVCIAGAVTHAVRKAPRLAGEDESVSAAVPVAADEGAVATAALAAAAAATGGGDLLYGRVDLARDAAGAPRVMELELVEPSLFLAQHPPALARLVAAVRARGAAPPRAPRGRSGGAPAPGSRG